MFKKLDDRMENFSKELDTHTHTKSKVKSTKLRTQQIGLTAELIQLKRGQEERSENIENEAEGEKKKTGK